MRTRSIFGVLLLFVVALSGWAVAVIVRAWATAPRIVEEHVRIHPHSLQLSDLSPEQLRILLAVEDPDFFSHHGVDLRTPGAGMTTITQGLVKFLYFDRFSPGIAKVRQSLLAIGFDARVAKQSQLALFINSGYLGTRDGRDILGFDDAAKTYFGRPFQDLTRDEYLALVAACIGPNEFRPGSARNGERIARIERLLAGQCRPDGLMDVYYAACAQ